MMLLMMILVGGGGEKCSKTFVVFQFVPAFCLCVFLGVLQTTRRCVLSAHIDYIRCHRDGWQWFVYRVAPAIDATKYMSYRDETPSSVAMAPYKSGRLSR